MGNDDWQSHHAELQAYMQHEHDVSGIPMQTDQEIVRGIGGHFCAGCTEGNALPQPTAHSKDY